MTLAVSDAATEAPPMVPAPTPGRIVMVRLPVMPGTLKIGAEGQVRPAIVTRAISPTQANVQVFLDGSNDMVAPHLHEGTLWLGTVDYAPPGFNVPRSWHWPERTGG